METLKDKFEIKYSDFLKKLGQVTSKILYWTFGKEITKRQKDKALAYWSFLQQEIKDRIDGLDVNIKVITQEVAQIYRKVEQMNLQGGSRT